MKWGAVRPAPPEAAGFTVGLHCWGCFTGVFWGVFANTENVVSGQWYLVMKEREGENRAFGWRLGTTDF